jgi:hypothetical protein
MDGLTSLALPLYIRYLLCFQPRAFRIFYGRLDGQSSTANEFPVERRLLYIMMPALAQKIHTRIEVLYALDGSPIISD